MGHVSVVWYNYLVTVVPFPLGYRRWTTGTRQCPSPPACSCTSKTWIAGHHLCVCDFIFHVSYSSTTTGTVNIYVITALLIPQCLYMDSLSVKYCIILIIIFWTWVYAWCGSGERLYCSILCAAIGRTRAFTRSQAGRWDAIGGHYFIHCLIWLYW